MDQVTVERLAEPHDGTFTNGHRAALGEHCQDVFRSLSRADQRRMSEAYVDGLLRCPGKKSIRAIARELPDGPSDQSLQQFVNQSNWDPWPVRRRLGEQVCGSGEPKAWVVGEVAFPKHGRQSAGVERQYVRTEERQSNCQVGVYVAYANEDVAVPVTWRLVIPRSWDADVSRRQKARVPADAVHQPMWRLQVEAVDDLCGEWGLPLAPVVIDLREPRQVSDAFGQLYERGLEYIARVDHTVPVRVAAAAMRGGRRPDDGWTPAEGPLDRIAAAFSGIPRRTLAWPDPATGAAVRSQFVSVSVRSTGGMPQVLLVEWGMGKRTPRAFWLSNMVDRGLEELVALVRLRARAGADVSAMCALTGLCDYEGRSFPGWHHHVTLASVAYAFHLTRGGAARVSRTIHTTT